MDEAWLDLRVPYDDAARENSRSLLEEAVDHVRVGRDRPLRVCDIGAGTGNSARWFDSALRDAGTGAPEWTLVDQDPAALRIAQRKFPTARTLHSPIRGLGPRLAPHGSPDILTAGAVLDVLTPADIEALLDLIGTHHAPGLFLLNITGDWVLDPPAGGATELAAGFARHQARSDRLGARAPGHLVEQAEARGHTVLTGPSPWSLDASDPTFLRRFLGERVAAAIEVEPGLQDLGRDWLADRLADPELQIRIDHLDVLVLPAGDRP